MNKQNFDYLKTQVKSNGFGDDLEIDLKKNIQKGAPEFTLKHHAKFGEHSIQAVLHFKKYAITDMYFFNKYDLSLTKPGQNEASIKQSFYIKKENNITLKKGYKLLYGHLKIKDLINREQKKYNALVKLDFKETDNKGNFQLKKYHEN